MASGDVTTPREPWFDRTRVIPFTSGAPAPYAVIHALQQRFLTERIASASGGPTVGAAADVVLIGEHERVITLGRGSKGEPPLLPIPVVAVERGGQATWHGPGQLVAYPIVALEERGLSIRGYLRALEAALIGTLVRFGLSGERRDGATGVWVGARKVASIGVAVRRHVSWHGVALNVTADLADFRLIDPCGFSPEVMTSMERLLAETGRVAPKLGEVRDALVTELARALHLAPPIWEKPALA